MEMGNTAFTKLCRVIYHSTACYKVRGGIIIVLGSFEP